MTTHPRAMSSSNQADNTNQIDGTRVIDTRWLDEQIGYLLRRASAAMAADYAAHAEPDALRPVQVSMLSVIAANPGMAQGELGAALGIQRSNIAPLVTQLVGAGLVQRGSSATDGRRVELHLSDAGQRGLATGRGRIAEHESRMTKALTDTERDQLRELLGRIIP